MGVTLQGKWKAWRRRGISSSVCRIVRDGVRLTFESRPELSPVPVNFSPPGDAAQQAALDEEIRQLVRKQVLEPVRTGELGYYSRMFLVPKKDGTWRPIIDLSRLNQYLRIPSFTMETPESIRTATCQGDWAVSIDLRDAYFHIPIWEEDRKYLSFSYKGSHWRFKNLCFGLATAPFAFMQIMKELKRILNLQGISVHVYLDDWLIRSQDREKLVHQTATVLALCQELGLMVNREKSDLIPRQDYVFLGYRFCNRSHRVFPPEDRIAKILSLIHTFQISLALPVRTWASLIGLLGSVDKIVPGGRLRIRPLQSHLMAQWKQAEDPSFSAWLGVAPTLQRDLDWWVQTGNWTRGVPTLPQNPSLVIYTDASNRGWGAHTESRKKQVSGLWNPTQKLWHINLLEMRAVVLALRKWETSCLGRTVLVASDNSTVVAYLNKSGGTRSASLNMMTVRLLKWAMARKISIRARHIPGNLNVLADRLSRRGSLIPGEWSLNSHEFRRLVDLSGFSPTIDLFATNMNAKLPFYVLPIPDKKAMAVDALSLNWSGMEVYAFPPYAILDKVIAKWLTDKPRMILVTSLRFQTEWYVKLRGLGKVPIELIPGPNLLSQSGKPHFNPVALKLHAWML